MNIRQPKRLSRTLISFVAVFALIAQPAYTFVASKVASAAVDTPHTTFIVPAGKVGSIFTVSGVATDNVALSRVYVQLVSRQDNQRYGGTTIHLSGMEQTWSHDFDTTALGLPDGLYAAHVSVTDTSGNTYASGWSANFTLDTKAPGISWQVQPQPIYGKNTGFSVRPITNEVNTIKSIYFNSVAPENLIRTLDSDHKNFDTSNGQNQALWDSLPDGTHKFVAVFADHAGNSTTSESREFVIDRTAPEIHFSSIDEVLKGEQTFKITQTEANPGRAYVEYMKKDEKGDYKKVYGSWFNDTNTFNYAVDTTKWADGEYQVKVSTWDKANNHTGGNLKFTIDNIRPTVSVKTGAGDSVGTHPYYSKVSFKLYDKNKNLKEVELNGYTYARGGEWNDLNWQNIQKSHLNEGENNTIIVRDRAGNESVPLTFTYDSVVPTVTGEKQTYETREGGRIAVELTFSERVVGGSLGQGWYEVAGSNGTKFVKRYYRTQDHTVSFRDLAGNTGTYNFTVDADAPVIATNIVDNAPLNDVVNVQLNTPGEANPNIANIRLLRPDGSSVQGQGFYTQNATNENVWVFDTKSVEDGQYRLQFSARDATGNAAEVVFRAITIDNAAPEASVEEDGSKDENTDDEETPDVIYPPAGSGQGRGGRGVSTPLITHEDLPTPLARALSSLATPASTTASNLSFMTALSQATPSPQVQAITEAGNDEEMLGTATNLNQNGEVLGASTDGEARWSLLNAIAVGIAVLLGILALLGMRRTSEDENVHAGMRIMTAAIAAAGVIALFLTEDFATEMGWMNGLSWVFGLGLVVQIILLIMARRTASE